MSEIGRRASKLAKLAVIVRLLGRGNLPNVSSSEKVAVNSLRDLRKMFSVNHKELTNIINYGIELGLLEVHANKSEKNRIIRVWGNEKIVAAWNFAVEYSTMFIDMVLMSEGLIRKLVKYEINEKHPKSIFFDPRLSLEEARRRADEAGLG